jgi:hypothetical protein
LWERVAGEVGRRPAQDFVLLFQLFSAFAQLTVPGLEATATAAREGRGGTAGQSVLTVGDVQPPGQAGLRDSDVSRHLCAGLITLWGSKMLHMPLTGSDW